MTPSANRFHFKVVPTVFIISNKLYTYTIIYFQDLMPIPMKIGFFFRLFLNFKNVFIKKVLIEKKSQMKYQQLLNVNCYFLWIWSCAGAVWDIIGFFIGFSLVSCATAVVEEIVTFFAAFICDRDPDADPDPPLWLPS